MLSVPNGIAPLQISARFWQMVRSHRARMNSVANALRELRAESGKKGERTMRKISCLAESRYDSPAGLTLRYHKGDADMPLSLERRSLACIEQSSLTTDDNFLEDFCLIPVAHAQPQPVVKLETESFEDDDNFFLDKPLTEPARLSSTPSGRLSLVSSYAHSLGTCQVEEWHSMPGPTSRNALRSIRCELRGKPHS